MKDLFLLRNLFDQLPVGVVLLDQLGRVVHYNRAEEKLANRKLSDVKGRSFFEDVAPCMNVRELGGRFREEIGRQRIQIEQELSFPFPFLAQPRDVHVRLTSFDDGGRSFGCLFVEDISAQRSVDRMKEVLGQFLVHDLKNPLAVVLANLDFLRADGLRATQPMIDEALADARRAGDRMQRMLLNLLDVTRLETGAFPIALAAVDLAGLLRAAADFAHGPAREREVSVACEGLAAPALLQLDKDVVVRAVDNLVENAVRHAPFGGRVTIGLRREPGAFTVLVADDGPGIPDEFRERIFEPYVSAASPVAGSHNRGLGLTFVRMAARAHGGTARVECPASGGSVFEIRLPCTAAA